MTKDENRLSLSPVLLVACAALQLAAFAVFADESPAARAPAASAARAAPPEDRHGGPHGARAVEDTEDQQACERIRRLGGKVVIRRGDCG